MDWTDKLNPTERERMDALELEIKGYRVLIAHLRGEAYTIRDRCKKRVLRDKEKEGAQ